MHSGYYTPVYFVFFCHIHLHIFFNVTCSNQTYNIYAAFTKSGETKTWSYIL